MRANSDSSCSNIEQEIELVQEDEIEVGPSEEDEVIVFAQDVVLVCSICSVDPVAMECSGSTRHGFCSECFGGYARNNFELNGEYQRHREKEGLVSFPGQLPCPYFVNGTCNCTSIHTSLIRRFVDDDTFEMWRKTDVRIAVAAFVKEQEKSKQRESEADEKRTPLETLRLVIQEALTKGTTVSCPKCKTKGEKDDQCMHITCQTCGTNWCYCCGRERGSEGAAMCTKENGCDATSAYLENQPGWNRFSIGDESQGQGALHEFHRRRIAYLIKQIKQNTDPELWINLRTQYPDVLDNVPTFGRCIDWDSIDDAIIPTFGRTQALDVKWNVDGNEMLNSLCEQIKNAIENQKRNEIQKNPISLLQQRFAQSVLHGISRSQWILFGLQLIPLVALISSAIIIEESTAKMWSLIGSCIYGACLLAYLITKAIDWRYAVLLYEEDEMVLPCAEVQFCGSPAEFPYLSSTGRWSSYRYYYLILLSGCLIIGPVLIVRHNFYKIGVTILSFVVTVFGIGTFVINLSPPPTSTSYHLRLNAYRKNIICLLALGGIFFPVGLYTYLISTDSGKSWQAILGSMVLGASCACILSKISSRCLNPEGFALEKGEILANKQHLFFWCCFVSGMLIFVQAKSHTWLIVGCVLSFSPTMIIILKKIIQRPEIRSDLINKMVPFTNSQ